MGADGTEIGCVMYHIWRGVVGCQRGGRGMEVGCLYRYV